MRGSLKFPFVVEYATSSGKTWQRYEFHIEEGPLNSLCKARSEGTIEKGH